MSDSIQMDQFKDKTPSIYYISIVLFAKYFLSLFVYLLLLQFIMSKIIHICHFLNPYCFYFKFDDDLHDDGLGRLEDEISKYARDKINQSSDEKTTIAVGYTVAAYVISWGKWVRSVIRSDLDIWNCYELWAIDHGRPFRAAHGNVVVLPVHLANGKFNGARRGSVYGLSPAKLVCIHFDSLFDL